MRSMTADADAPRGPIGFAATEVRIDEPTRSARLKWVVVVNADIPVGLAANAVACVAASSGQAVTGLIGPGGRDASGFEHPGLPWAGCALLSADGAALGALWAKAALREDVLVVDMPAAAQDTRVYREYLDALSTTPADDLVLYALSLVGPRNAVDRLVGKLPLLA